MIHQARFYLFGPPRLERNAKTIQMDTRKAVALLAYLVLGESRSGDGGYTRDTLAALLYPDSDESSARAALRRTLSTLRKALGAACLETNHERVALQPDCLWVDVIAFRQALAQTRMHGHASAQVCPACLPLLEQAAEMYRNGFMVGFSLRDSPSFDDWQFFQAESLRQEMAGLLEKLASGLAAQGDFSSAASQTRRWLALDPLCESAHRLLMQVYAWDGQRNAALRQYRECVRILHQELGVPPLEETTRLYQAVLENRLPAVPRMNAPHPAEPAQAVQPAPSEMYPAQGASPQLHSQAYPLVGRNDEQQTLMTAYTNANRGFFFALEGEAGIGKSRMAEAFLQQVTALGGRVMQARCYESEAGLAYAPFMDGLSAAIAQPEAALRLQSASPACLSLAAQLAPGLTELFPGLPPPLPPDSPGVQVRFFDALRTVIRALVSPLQDTRPLGVLFLDDLQWADQASLDLLDYLTRRPDGLFLLAAWRSDAVPADHHLRQLLAQAGRDGNAASLCLPRLQLQDISALLSVLPTLQSEQFTRHLFQDSEGNPFFVIEYLKAHQAMALQSGEPDWEIPHSVRSLLLTRLASVGEVSAQLLSAAAVLGRSFDFTTLREVSGRSELETVEALEELQSHGLLWERGPDQPVEPQPSATQLAAEVQYDFTHDKLREITYEQTSLARRRLLHQRSAEVYTGQARLRHAAAPLAALHFRLAGQLPQAAEWYLRAGEYGRQVYANRESIAHFQNALACGHPEPAVLHEAIGDLQLLQGAYPTAISSFEAAASLCTPQHLPWLEHKLGRVQALRGDFDLAECHLRAALDELDSLPTQVDAAPAERAMIVADWSHTAYRLGDTSRARELALQALSLAQACQDEYAQAQAFNNLGILERVDGHFGQAIQHLQCSLEIAEHLGDPGPRAAALNNLARVYAESGQFDQAIRLTGQALELCRQRGDRHREAALLNNLADLHHAAGQDEASMDYLRKAVVIFAEIGVEPASAAEQTPAGSTLGMLPEVWKLSEW